MMAAILNTAILNSSHFDSAILHKTLTQTNSLIHLISASFCTKNSFIHSDSTWWCAAILNSAILDSDTAILDSDTLLSSLRFTQKHSHSTLTLTQTNSILMIAAILKCAILDSAILHLTSLIDSD